MTRKTTDCRKIWKNLVVLQIKVTPINLFVSHKVPLLDSVESLWEAGRLRCYSSGNTKLFSYSNEN